MSIKPAKPPTAAAQPKAVFAGQSYQGQPDDVIDDLLGIVAGLLPGVFTPELRAKADSIGRERWGGDKPYISRRAGEGRSERNANIRRDHRRGASIPLLERRYSLSRRHLHRLLSLDGDEPI